MTVHRVVHGSFTIERTYRAPVERVFAAWCDIDTKARWFIGPPDEWKPLERKLDLRVGGIEILKGELSSGTITTFTARYHEIVPNQRLIYAYDMHHAGEHLSVSLATMELAPAGRGSTRMTFTEQAAFLDGKDGTKSRELGTSAHFDRLEPVLEDPTEIVSARVFDAPRELVFRAFSDPIQLARWWGPNGFTNTIEQFDLRPGGTWKLVMLGPDGTNHPNQSEFSEVVPPERVVFRHLKEMHQFDMAMTFIDLGARTHLTWRMRFDRREDADAVRTIVTDANEQNFDRLAQHLLALR